MQKQNNHGIVLNSLSMSYFTLWTVEKKTLWKQIATDLETEYVVPENVYYEEIDQFSVH